MVADSLDDENVAERASKGPVTADDVVSWITCGDFQRVWIAHDPDGDSQAVALAQRIEIESECTVKVQPWTARPGQFYDLVIYLDAQDGGKSLLHGRLSNGHVVAIRLDS